MSETKTIAIIEATSEMGSAIAKSLLNIGTYRLLLMSNDQVKLEGLLTQLEKPQRDTEVFTMSCAREASWEADIIIVATPHGAEAEVGDRIREVATGKIVISISNPLIEAYYYPVTSDDTSAAEELQKLLPYSKVVKAFSTMFPVDFIQRPLDKQALDVFISGNNWKALETVSQIVAHAGFNPIVVGDLTVSRTLERVRFKLIQHSIKDYNWPGVWKILYT